MKYLLCLFTCVVVCLCSQAQIIISFQPALNGQTLNGLSFVQIVNSYAEESKGSFKVTVKDGAGTEVVSILVPQIAVHPGVNTLNRGVFSSSNIRFGGSPAASILHQSGRFPEGEYEYCFELDVAQAKPTQPPVVYENCFTQALQPTTPLLLTDPYDGAEICNLRPGFSWQPPMPLQGDMRYQIVVAPVNGKQQPTEALANNKPVINIANLRQFNIIYPAGAADLVKEQTYAWQVTALSGRTVVTQSEIWTFKVHCDDSIPAAESGTYRELKPDGDKNYYIASGGIIRFSFNNYYSAGKLEYEIVDLANPDNVIKKLPRLNMQTGHNKIDLKPSGSAALKSGNQYLLKVKNAGSQELTMRFIYQEN
jgi:hypothetical protein